MTPSFGIYQAIVTDNSKFFINGKIKVKVQNLYNGKMEWDLTRNFDYNKFIKELPDDIWALVYTPMGGGSNHGMFALPQINSVGLVQFMNGNIKRPIWMGSFFRPEYDQNGKIARVNVPNDQASAEGSGADGITQNDNGIGEKRIEGGFGTLILRTKTTSGPGLDRAAEHMNFNEQRTENLVVLSEDKLHATHFSKWQIDDDRPVARQFEELDMGMHQVLDAAGDVVEEYPEINMKVTDITGRTGREQTKTTGLIVNNKEVGLTVIDEARNLKSVIGSSEEGVDIRAINTDNNKETAIRLSPEEIVLQNDVVNILIENDEISISSPTGKIRLSGKEILLGDGGGYVVVSDVPGFSMRHEDGSIIKASLKTRA